jgi:hypothetical protein
MPIKRYTADADNTITNAFKANLTTRGTGSNTGESDIMEVFSIYGQNSGSTYGYSQELARSMIRFPISDISADRTAGTLPASGNVSFYLRLFNAAHAFTVPKNMQLVVAPMRQAWEEGNGLDNDEYSDSTYDGSGSNWLRRGTSSAGVLSWDNVGGDFYGQQSPATTYTVTFPDGTENMEVDISELVEEWVKGAAGGGIPNNGIMVKLTGSQEAYSSAGTSTALVLNTTGAKDSYYTKKFFARGSEYFFKRPCIEARYDDTDKDDRGNFFYSSSLSTALENLNTLYLYNYVRGQLTDIPNIASDHTGEIYASFFSGNLDNTAPTGDALECVADGQHVRSANVFAVTGGYVSTGIYSASVALTGASTPLARIYDVWFTGSHDTSNAAGSKVIAQFSTGSFVPATLSTSPIYSTPTYTTKITNLKDLYGKTEKPRFRVFVRKIGDTKNIYTKATAQVQNTIIDNAYYRVYRLADNTNGVVFGTGSSPGATGSKADYTRLSFDVSGNYFDFDMSLLERDYAYGIKFAYYTGEGYLEQPEIFKFRVEEKS